MEWVGRGCVCVWRGERIEQTTFEVEGRERERCYLSNCGCEHVGCSDYTLKRRQSGVGGQSALGAGTTRLLGAARRHFSILAMIEASPRKQSAQREEVREGGREGYSPKICSQGINWIVLTLINDYFMNNAMDRQTMTMKGEQIRNATIISTTTTTWAKKAHTIWQYGRREGERVR